ncbi:MAG: lysophospholipid acyltransferase family protein, partial [Fimbriiglobus sp.]
PLPHGFGAIYAVWHENLMLPTIHVGGPDFSVLISKHADGRLLGALIDAMGMGQVQGSTNRGGIEAVRQIVRGEAGRRHLAITPDGPRGPRRIVQAGIVYVASRTGMPIISMGVGYHRPWRLGSWDKFAVPKPGSRARVVFGEPIRVPAKLRAELLEPYRLAVQTDLERASAIAERWAETGRFMLPAADAPPAPLRLAS